MPIRIYSLAKELNIENKDLVDACNRAGIHGKGSALASLTEEEVVKIKAFLDGSGKKAGGKASDDAPTPSRPSAGASRQPIKVLPRQSAKPLGGRVGRDDAPLDSGSGLETGGEYSISADSSGAEIGGGLGDEAAFEASADVASVATAEPVWSGGDAAIDSPADDSPVSEATEPVAERAADRSEAASDANSSPTSADEEESPARPSREAPLARRDYGPAPTGKIKILDAKNRRPPLSKNRGDDGERAGSERSTSERTGSDRTSGDRPLADRGSGDRGSGSGDRGRPRRGPAINLAKMPEVKQPKPTAPLGERTQKPVMRLPKDAIASGKKGTLGKGVLGPLNERIKQAEKANKLGQRKPGDKPAPAEGQPGAADKDGRRRRGKGGPAQDGELSDMGSVRPNRLKAKGPASGRGQRDRDGEEGYGSRRKLKRQSGPKKDSSAPRKGNVVLELPCTVRSFCEATGVSSKNVQGALMRLGQLATINQQINPELVEPLILELGLEIDLREQASLEETLINQVAEQADPPESLEARPPIVTFLGHVDHGKTSLLDAIIGTNVVAGEAGGITQHIRAYSIVKGDRKISFVDTPGHEAFTEMRARGANVTDVAVIVIAADDGIMPQTEEAISHAKAAGVPIVVALNKIDLPGANPTRVMEQLSAIELLPSEWGGETEVVKTSATKGQGVPELLDTLLLTADIHEFKANPNKPATGVCLEAEQEEERGVIAKLMVQSGTLNVGDIVVCGTAHGRVKAMYDTLRPRTKLKSAGPSIPVNVTGLDSAPQAGQGFYVLSDIAQAREIAASRESKSREQQLSGHTVKVSFDEFQKRLTEGKLAGKPEDVVKLNLIIRADVRGSIEAIVKELGKLEHPEIEIKILQASVGGITKADVVLAQASQAVIVGFNVIPDEAARVLADEREIEIRRYDIIYKVADDIKAMLERRLKPEERVVELGHAIVKQVFNIGRVGVVAGCYVANGSIERGCRIRVNRNQRTIGEYDMESLRRVKDDVKEVSRGMDCGIKLKGFNDIKQDDILEAYKIEQVARTL